jgi:hypothetical protein
MKKVIELLQTASGGLEIAGKGGFSRSTQIAMMQEAQNHINAALVELKSAPRWETTEQWERRTGEPWPDDWAVYVQITRGDNGYVYKWKPSTLREALINKSSPIWENHQIEIICATEAGPPPEDWRPE